MSTNETTTPGAPAWIDLTANDPQAAIDFYSGLFGWTAEPLGDEWLFRNDGAVVAGLSSTSSIAGRPDGWLVWLLSADVDSTSLAAHSNGGDVLGRDGEMIIVQDSQGALVGAWNPGEHTAYLYDREVGAPTWHELYATDYDSAVEFYQNVFEWEPQTMSDTPEFRYTVLPGGENGIAGIYDAGKDGGDVTAHWEVYFEVADADAAAAKLTELGGRLLDEPTDTPYGRMVHAADPAGNTFTLIAH